MADPTVVEFPQFSRAVSVARNSFNANEGTVDVVWSTGAAVKRTDFWTGKSYIEKLSMDPTAIRLGRLNAGAPVLNAHSAESLDDQIGVVVDGSARVAGGKGHATVRFSARPAVAPIRQDVADGILRNLSVGYVIHKFIEEPGRDESIPIRTAVDWEPHEISLVPLPADAGAQVRGGTPPTDGLYPCEIVSRNAGISPQESDMDDRQPDSIAETDPLRLDLAPTPPPAPAEQTDRDLGAEAERARIVGIRFACKSARMPRALEDELIDQKVPLVEAQKRCLIELDKRGTDAPAAGSRPRIEISGEDPLIHARAGILNALLNRVAGDRFALDDNGRRYRGMTCLDIGRAFINARGGRTTNMSRSELVDAMLSRANGMHTTSDFPSLFEDAANKNLRSAYEAAPQTWLPLAKAVSISDFKPSRQLQVGDAPALDEVLEHGEFTQGTIAEAKESVQLKTYGKIFAITRQALINDDLNAFGEIPAAFGRKARDKESDLAWAQITANPTMGDGTALFHANHANLSGTSDAISITSLGAARAALRVQKGLDGATILNLAVRYLIVPAAKETLGDQNVTQITPAAATNVSPFAAGGRTPLTLIVEPRLDVASATAWYVATSVEQAPVLYYATLDGQSGPEVRQQEGFNVDGMQFRARIDVAFKAADWRAIFKNPGA